MCILIFRIFTVQYFYRMLFMYYISLFVNHASFHRMFFREDINTTHILPGCACYWKENFISIFQVQVLKLKVEE